MAYPPRRPPPPSRTVSASVSVSKTSQAQPQSRAPLRPPAEIEQPIYHPDQAPPDESLPPDEDQAENKVVTVGEEQLARSLEMQQMGVNNWVAAHDERNPEEQPQSVEGVTPLER